MFRGQRTDQSAIWELEITQPTQKLCGASSMQPLGYVPKVLSDYPIKLIEQCIFKQQQDTLNHASHPYSV